MGVANESIQGYFTSDGNPRLINIPCGVDYFELFNYTAFESTANPGVTKRAWWFRGLADGAAFRVQNTNSAATDQSDILTTGGFTEYSGTPSLGAAVTGTAITAANPAVVTANSHGYSVGDFVVCYGTTGMLQIAGMEFTVTAVGGANAFTLGYLNSSGFAAPATACTFRKWSADYRFYPRRRYITAITAANPAVVTMSATHGLTVGQKVRLIVPSGFGMTQANGVIGTISAISTANNTITLSDVNSSSWTAFAFPTSASAAAGISFPQVVPIGDSADFLDGATENVSQRGLILGSSICGAASDVIYWRAVKSSDVSTS